MARLVIVIAALLASATPSHAGAIRFVAATRVRHAAVEPARPRASSPVTARSTPFGKKRTAPFLRAKPTVVVATSPAAPKKVRWNRESTGHAVRLGLAIGTPFVAPMLAVHAPLVATGLAAGFGLYAVRGAYESIRAGYRAAKTTPRDGWWTAYDKFAAFAGGFFSAREGLSKLFLGGGIGAQLAASVFTAVPAFASVGAELVNSGSIRALTNILMPQRIGAVTAVAVADTEPKR